jgi:hypothetical protein
MWLSYGFIAVRSENSSFCNFEDREIVLLGDVIIYSVVCGVGGCSYCIRGRYKDQHQYRVCPHLHYAFRTCLKLPTIGPVDWPVFRYTCVRTRVRNAHSK